MLTRLSAVLGVCALAVAAVAQTPPAAVPLNVTIDTQSGRHPISPFIYGQNTYPDQARSAHNGLWRLGGNRYTGFNWENNASYAGADYINSADDFLQGGAAPGGIIAQFVGKGPAFNKDLAIMMTIPIEGWVARDKSGQILTTIGPPGTPGGDQDMLRRFCRDEPRKPGGPASFSKTPDTSDDAVYQDEFVSFLQDRYGKGVFTAPTQRLIFELDNEPDLWKGTHPLLRPLAEPQKVDPRHAKKPNDVPEFVRTNASFTELTDKQIAYAEAIKDVAPTAEVYGPAVALLPAWRDLDHAPEYPATGEYYDYFVYWLRHMKAAEQQYGRRVLDGWSFHWYPQLDDITSDNVDAKHNAERIQNPRIFWDPTYREDSWVGRDITPGDGPAPHPLYLLRRAKETIAREYPGTKLAITEYNFGGPSDISGGIAQADVLGIFGREGVSAAAWWPLETGNADRPWGFIYGAFDIYRNFDGHDGSFGDTAVDVSATGAGAAPDQSSVYASVNASDPRHVYVVCINKTERPLEATIAVKGTAALATADAFELTQATSQVRPAGSQAVTDNALRRTLPPLSVTLLRFGAP